MRVVIAHNAVDDHEAPDARDVEVQVDAVAAALHALGHTAVPLPCSLDLALAKRRLAELAPDCVFNLVESLDGTGRLIHLVPGLLDALGLPYTGAPAEAVALTSHKILAKQLLSAARLPTPAWIGPFPADAPDLAAPPETPPGAQWIVKSVWEHASIGLDETDLTLMQNATEAAAALPERAPRLGGACFAECFIAGREFNLSLLAAPQGPQLLPPAEILFEGYPENRPRIVGYRAKWDPGSFEFSHTPRRFEFPRQDAALLERLGALALSCWKLFGLNGYARVDFRVDGGEEPWILEINANPCLSPDAGFAAALETAGIPFQTAVARIIAAAGRKGG
jgi:D-alanine-D-alanine ligase